MKKATKEVTQGKPGYIRRDEAARYLGVSLRTLGEWQQRKLIPYIKISHRVCLFRKADLDRALEKFTTKAIGD